MSDDYRQRLIDALGELAWTLDAQGRKADSLTCTKAAIQLSAEPEAATNRNAVIMPLEPLRLRQPEGEATIDRCVDICYARAKEWFALGEAERANGADHCAAAIKELKQPTPHEGIMEDSQPEGRRPVAWRKKNDCGIWIYYEDPLDKIYHDAADWEPLYSA